MPEIKFKAVIHAMPSDLLEGKVKITFALQMTEQTLAMRHDLAMLKVLGEEVEVVVRSPQKQLPGMDIVEDFQNSIPDGETVTFSTADKSVTVKGRGKQK